MKRERLLLTMLVALAAGAAAYVAATRGLPRHAGPQDADYYCYELRQGWVCMYAQRDCEARLAAEPVANVQLRCVPHTNDPPSP